MSGKIHWGSQGSYKTSAAVQEDVIPALKKGRVVVTNVRGLNKRYRIRHYLKHDRVYNTLFGFNIPWSYETLPRHINLPKIIYINGDSPKGREQLRTWFHWAPLGALILFDEIGVIYPKDWTRKKLHEYDYPGGEDQAEKDGRPHDLTTALEMHRHYNWDFVFTHPNWAGINPIVKENSEGAYWHRNNAMIGRPGSYNEIFHETTNNGLSSSNRLTQQNKRIRKSTFKLYKSTTTGEVKDTTAGKNIFLQPKVIMSAIALVSFWTFLLSIEPPKVMRDALANTVNFKEEPATANNQVLQPQQEQAKSVTLLKPVKNENSLSAKPIDLSPPPVPHAVHRNQSTLDPVSSFVTQSLFTIKGTIGTGERKMMAFDVSTKSGVRRMSLKDLNAMNIEVTSKTDCLAEITYKSYSTFATCSSSSKYRSIRKPNQPKLKL